MAVQASPSGCRRRSAWQPVIGQSLIWASMMIGNAILLRGTPVEDHVMLILLAGASASVLLTTAECRSRLAETDDGVASRP